MKRRSGSRGGIAVSESPHRSRLWPIVAVMAVLLVGAMLLSLMYGTTRYSLEALWSALLGNTPVKESLIMTEVRLPRLVVTLLIGANLGVAGAMMQAITRNPLASPSVFGLNAGAAFVVVAILIMFPAMPAAGRVFGGFAGALASVLLVFVLSNAIRFGKPEVKMALIGVTLQAFLSVGTQALLLFNESKAGQVMFWLTGSVVGLKWYEASILAFWSVAGLALSFALAPSLSILSLGDEMARGLGQKVERLRAVTIAAVVMLAGASVAVAGPIGFIGLMVPHLVRYLIGVDYRAVMPVSALLGALLLTAADVSSRWISFPGETPVGIVTALLGTPYFIYLARRRGARL